MRKKQVKINLTADNNVALRPMILSLSLSLSHSISICNKSQLIKRT